QIEFPDLGILNLDKLLHLVAYFFYSLLLMLFFISNFNFNKRKVLLITFVFATLYAISDEFHQSFVPGRDASVYDLLANILGISLSLLCNNFINKVSNFIYKYVA
ncbi:MAG TPA: VanZ family protein, partial [Candidatus Kapabacteria bacterium]|nr:VanZ family protein [Candidatus Kapabacteria bacterium]